jgi:hypothetical protein
MPKDREESSTTQSSTVDTLQMAKNWVDVLNATQLRELGNYLREKTSRAAKEMLHSKNPHPINSDES